MENQNKITTVGLDLILSHLYNRLSGFKFEKELSMADLLVQENYSLYQIQCAAEKMILHLAMIGYTPIINLCELPNHAAGSINLNNEMLVYINLDKKKFDSHYYTHYQIISIIAHELCHKFLWIHGFKETSHKIEYITDACAVFVGFGKVMINGYKDVRQNTYDGLQFGTQTIKIGYLSTWQLSYLRKKIFSIPIPLRYRIEMVRTELTILFVILFIILPFFIMIIHVANI